MNKVNNYGMRVKTVTNYEEFKILYMELFNIMFSYKPRESGSFLFAGYLGELVDNYPEWEKKIDSEN
jgi:hypothetical protein